MTTADGTRWERFSERDRALITMGLVSSLILSRTRAEDDEDDLPYLKMMLETAEMVQEISETFDVGTAFTDESLIPRLRDLIAARESEGGDDDDLLALYVRACQEGVATEL